MLEKFVQIFMSYSRTDNALPPDLSSSESKGFVTFLYQQLAYELKQVSGPCAKIWYDSRQVADGDLFDVEIADAIKASSLLIVVLSKNWMESKYCREELAAFTERWKNDPNIRERIVVVGKHHIDPDRRPSLLQNQVGYLFYTRQEADEIEPEKDFFVRGKVRDDRYLERVSSLTTFLSRRVERFTFRAGDQQQVPSPTPTKVATPLNRRTVYLSKPAGDMREAYDRLVKELVGAGYGVVPDPALDLPVDSNATNVIDAALAQANASIHLLGQKPGFAPEGQEPIVQLQLRRATAELAKRASVGSEGRPLKRIVWAPKVASAGEWDGERDPLGVLSLFDGYIEGDIVEGATLSRFVEFLVRQLGSPIVQMRELEKLEPKSRIYVYYDPRDVEFGYSIAKALKERNLTPMWPALQGSDAENSQEHYSNLRECDSVILCWAAAPDTWVKANSRELSDWRLLGRSRMFAWRGLIAGPPPGLPKRMFVDLNSSDEIDVILDLTSGDLPPKADDLNQLLTAH